MSSVSEIVEATAEGFDAEREELNLENSSAHLLVRTGQTTDFTILHTLVRAWKNQFSDFKGAMNLQIADEDEPVVDAIKKCSDMSIDGYIYQVDTRDRMPPDGDRPWWDLYGVRTGEIFEAP